MYSSPNGATLNKITVGFYQLGYRNNVAKNNARVKAPGLLNPRLCFTLVNFILLALLTGHTGI